MSEAFLIGGSKIERLEGVLGTTPACPEARFQRGDIVRTRRNKAVGHWPHELIILAVIPPLFSPDDAMADMLNRPRPFMKQVGSRRVTYILCEEDNPKAYLTDDRNLISSGKPAVEIGSVSMGQR